jgi:hypothetical protein
MYSRGPPCGRLARILEWLLLVLCTSLPLGEIGLIPECPQQKRAQTHRTKLPARMTGRRDHIDHWHGEASLTCRSFSLDVQVLRSIMSTAVDDGF